MDGLVTKYLRELNDDVWECDAKLVIFPAELKLVQLKLNTACIEKARAEGKAKDMSAKAKAK